MLNSINLKFKHSIDFETQRVLYTYNKLDWFQEKGYKVSWPNNIDLLSKKTLSENYIKKIIKEEYKAEEYKEVKIKIEELWKSKSKEIIENILNAKLDLKKEYVVYLTKYGVGGSYHLPNKIVLNFKNKDINSLLKIIIHEIIHLCIQFLIEKYKIKHWQKERVVDLIVLKAYPKWKKTQKVPFDTKNLNKIFFDNYPNIDKILRLLANP